MLLKSYTNTDRFVHQCLRQQVSTEHLFKMELVTFPFMPVTILWQRLDSESDAYHASDLFFTSYSSGDITVKITTPI